MSQKTYTIPAKLVSQFEARFLTEEWEAKEKEADEAIAKSKFLDFECVDNLINELHSHV